MPEGVCEMEEALENAVKSLEPEEHGVLETMPASGLPSTARDTATHGTSCSINNFPEPTLETLCISFLLCK